MFSIPVHSFGAFAFGADLLSWELHGRHLTRISAPTGRTTDVGEIPVQLWNNSELLPVPPTALLVLPEPLMSFVAAIHPDTAQVKWKVALEDKAWALAAAIRNHVAYVVAKGKSEDQLLAIDTQQGRVIWTVLLGSFDASQVPVADDDGVLVQGWLRSQHERDTPLLRSFTVAGTERWSYRPSWSPVVAVEHDELYLAIAGEGVRSLGWSDGKERRSLGATDVGFWQVIARSGTLYYVGGPVVRPESGEQSVLTGALDLDSGRERWRHVGSSSLRFLMADCSAVYTLTDTGDVSALSRETGETLWTWSFGKSVTLAPGPAEGSLIANGHDQVALFVPAETAMPKEHAVIRGRVRKVYCGRPARQELSICGKAVRTDARGNFRVECDARGTVGVFDSDMPARLGPLALVPLRGVREYTTSVVLDHCIEDRE